MRVAETGVRWRGLRAALLVGALVAAAAGQYWLSIEPLPRLAGPAWSLAVAAFVGAYLLAADRRELPAFSRTELPRRLEWVLFAVVMISGAFFTLFRLTTIPAGLNHDAAWEGMYAIRILNGEPYAPYVNEAWGRETFTFYLRAASIWLLGPTRLAVTAPSMLCGVLVLPFFYWWARNMFGIRVALLATLLLGASGWHLIFSRTGWRSDFQPFFTVLTCCFFIRGMITARVLDFALSGISLALTVNTYNGARAFPFLFPLWLLACLLQSWRLRGFVRRYGLGLLAMTVAAGVVVAPLAWFAFHHWSIFQSRAEALEGSASLLETIKESVLLFNVRANGDDFFTTTPGLEYPAAIFLVFGALWVILHLQDERAQFLILGLVVNAAPGLVSRPNMNRDIGTMPFVYFLVALGVCFFAIQLRCVMPRLGRALATVLVGAVGAGAMVATYTQYLGAHRRPIWGFYPETTVMGNYMKTLVPRYEILVGDAYYFPRDALTYLTYQGVGNPERRNYVWLDDVRVLLRARLVPPAGKGLAFVLENAGHGRWVFEAMARHFPHHQEVDLRYPTGAGPVFAKVLLVPPDAVAQAAAGPIAPPTPVAPRAPAGQLEQPRGLAAAPDGHVVVCDFGNNRLQEFGADFGFVRQWGSGGVEPGQFNQPCGVAVDRDGRVYVTDTWNHRVQVFSAAGQYERQWSGAFFGPRGVAVDGQGRVYVADTGDNRIVRFSPEGRVERVWGSRGSEPGHFLGPVGIAVDGAGQVYVCDNGNARLQIFTGDGTFVRSFAVPGWGDRPFSEPYVTIDPRGTVWVTVPTAREVRNYDGRGKLLHSISPGSLPGVTFTTPIGIAYDAAAHALVVSDLANGLIRVPYPIR